MNRAAVGFRVHSGWTSLVALAVVEGTPAILARERVNLVKKFTYEFRQPYHTGVKLPLEEARAFIFRSRAEARGLAWRAVRNLQVRLEEQGYKLVRSGVLLASGSPLPRLPQILASHALIHTADGELFREALLHASDRCGLEAVKIKERELLDSASRALKIKASEITRRIVELGRPLGPPWSQDEKFASIVAWLAAASRS